MRPEGVLTIVDIGSPAGVLRQATPGNPGEFVSDERVHEVLPERSRVRPVERAGPALVSFQWYEKGVTKSVTCDCAAYR